MNINTVLFTADQAEQVTTRRCNRLLDAHWLGMRAEETTLKLARSRFGRTASGLNEAHDAGVFASRFEHHRACLREQTRVVVGSMRTQGMFATRHTVDMKGESPRDVVTSAAPQ